MFMVDQSFRGSVRGRKFLFYGRMWIPNREVGDLVWRAGGTVVSIPEPGANLSDVYLVLSTVVLVPKDTIGFAYELADSPVAAQLQAWLDAGARPLAERDLREALEPSAMGRRRAALTRAEARRLFEMCGSVLTLLDDVIRDD